MIDIKKRTTNLRATPLLRNRNSSIPAAADCFGGSPSLDGVRSRPRADSLEARPEKLVDRGAFFRCQRLGVWQRLVGQRHPIEGIGMTCGTRLLQVDRFGRRFLARVVAGLRRHGSKSN